ncbi:FMN-binding negative transcriptional regulator [Burkholderia pseudomultivorans]|uniref:Transcriptional regulator n=1 Tax=Burkholderia pseudomultivorans TaxID=1207504 RepID=A0A132EX70_9BURK|nr:FMN-binding negative transcriptional regulator [Burkholderia pseudomultivorans]KWF62760.1 transcriptional regulator [Burkholderia pseudomultivorans]MBF5011327.1 FMN-binding negative transcriptional regulator [Burkholderia pseudomultivorans]
MYVPADFDESRPDALRELIVQHPFGSLITHGADGLDANHLPFELVPVDGGLGELHAHVARANPVWRAVANGDEVLAIFRAGDAYISPNWYPSKHATHRQVPTWNYVVVHAHGRITVRDDEKFVRGVVARLTRTHEASQPVPWKMGDAPQDYLDTMLQSIVGLQIEITRLVGKRKLGQNKAAADIRGAADALIANGQAAIGDAMLAEADAKREREAQGRA